MERTKRTLNNISWGAINTFTGIVLPFATRTVIIYIFGIDYIGLGSLFNSILQILSFTELGLGSALVYSMYEPIARKDDAKVCALLNFYKKSYRTIGIVVLLIGCVIAPFLEYFINGNTPVEVNVYALFFIYLLNNVLSYFLFAEKASLLLACQRDDINSKILVGVKIALNIGQILTVVIIRNYYAFTICIPLFTVAQHLICNQITKRMYPKYYYKGEIDKFILTDIKKNVGGMVFQKIGNIVLTAVDTIVISTFLGLKVLGIYNGYYYIFTSLNGFLGVILRSLVPSVGNSMVSSSIEKNYADFKRIHMIYDWIVVWWTACLLCLMQPFMELWVGEELMLPDSMVILFALYFFFFKWLDITYVYRESSGIWWEGKWLPIIASIVNLVLNIVLVQIIGLAGILLSTIISLLLVHDTMGTYILKKYCFCEVMSLKYFFLRQLLIFITGGIVCGATYFICDCVAVSSAILVLIIRGIICIVIPNLLLIILWSRWGVTCDIYDLVKKGFSGKLHGRIYH